MVQRLGTKSSTATIYANGAFIIGGKLYIKETLDTNHTD